MRTAYPVPVSRLQAFGPAVGPLLGVCNNVNVHGTEPVRMAQYILSLFNVTFISHVWKSIAQRENSYLERRDTYFDSSYQLSDLFKVEFIW
jgi:hypothetical protein